MGWPARGRHHRDKTPSPRCGRVVSILSGSPSGTYVDTFPGPPGRPWRRSRRAHRTAPPSENFYTSEGSALWPRAIAESTPRALLEQTGLRSARRPLLLYPAENHTISTLSRLALGPSPLHAYGLGSCQPRDHGLKIPFGRSTFVSSGGGGVRNSRKRSAQRQS